MSAREKKTVPDVAKSIGARLVAGQPRAKVKNLVELRQTSTVRSTWPSALMKFATPRRL